MSGVASLGRFSEISAPPRANDVDMNPDQSRNAARRGLLWFGALVFAFSVTLEVSMARTGRPIGELGPMVLALMWTPGLVSILVRLVRREGFGDVSFRWGGAATWRALFWVIAYPTIVGAIAYGIAWGAGLATFHPPASTFSVRPSTDFGRLALRYAAAVLPGTPLSLISALGEEIGWRGYFVDRLVRAGIPRPLFVSGVVWGLWHVPLILTGQYAAGPSPLLSAGLFLVSIVPAAYLFGWARLTTGSLWPAAFAHAAWNSIIQGVFDESTVAAAGRRASSIWTGESGLLVAATSAIFVLVFLRHEFAARSRPSAEPHATLSLRNA